MARANLDFKNISWEEAKDKLIAKYGQDREMKDYRELLRNLVIGKTEQVAHFFDRWENLRLEGQLQDSSDLAKMLLNSLSGNQFLQKTLFSHLLVHSGGLFTSAEHLKGATMDLVRSPVWTMMVDNLGAPSSGVSSGARPSSSKRTDGNCPTHGGKSGSGADHDLEECKAYVDQKRRQHDRVDDRRQRRNQRSRSRSGSRDDYSHHHKSKHYQQYRRDHHQQRDQQHRGGNRQDRDARSSNGAPYPKHHKNKTWSRDSKDNDKPTDSYGKKFYSMKAASRRSPSPTKTTTSGVRVSPPPAGPSSLVPDADAIMHDGQQSSGKKFCMMKGVKQETKDDDSPSVPLLIQDVEAMALVDTGATLSAISPSFCNKNNIKILPSQGSVITAIGNRTMKRTGCTEPLKVTHGNRVVQHSFDVLDMSGDTQVCVGYDLFNKIGMYIGGMATSYYPPVIDTEESDDELPRADSSPVGTAVERARMMKVIAPLIQANQDVPKDSFCTMEESVIYLDTPPGQTAFRRQYPIPFALRPVVDQAIAEWIRNGTVKKATTVNMEWNSPLTLAPKKNPDGTIAKKRPCLDPRMINRLLPDDRFPLPLIDDIFSQLAGSSVFTTLDLKSAFHRFKIHEPHQVKTSFMHGDTQYVFQGCPFGLKPISSKFQRVMAKLLQDLPFATAFVDDIVIFSKTLHDHISHVKVVIERLTAVNLVLNPDKCHFAHESVTLLERMVQTTTLVLKKELNSQLKDWDEYVPMVAYATNAKIAPLHNSAPFSLMFFRRLNGFIDYRSDDPQIERHVPSIQERDNVEELIDNVEHVIIPAITKRIETVRDASKNSFNNKNKIVEFGTGSLVAIAKPTMTRKLEPKYEGPFQVVEKNRGGAYKLKDIRLDELLPGTYAPHSLKSVSEDPTIQSEPSYEIDCVVDVIL
ncbi:hypothetical protein [Absidia glauca]|uniref:Reverse transcriptase domain-containing protein n=1 Tax=Absidia glauca TaxID=4829 RepID=A0A168LS58_ABSGL|nr:hypothetical protein [Absidia glauca]